MDTSGILPPSTPSESSFAPSAPPPPPLPVPAVVTVFGIMHLVLALLGVVMTGLSGVMQNFSRSMMQEQAGAPGIAGAQARMQQQILESAEKLNVFTYTTVIVLTLLLSISGILLLKRRLAGIKVSNAYACLSILFKLAGLVVFFAWTLPQMDPLMAEMAKTGGPEAQMMGNIMRGSMMLSGVLSPLVMCVYPVLVLFLLNRPKVKEALAAASR